MGLLGEVTYTSKTIKANLTRGATDRKIIRVIIRDGREYRLHATKGWRSYRHTPKPSQDFGV